MKAYMQQPYIFPNCYQFAYCSMPNPCLEESNFYITPLNLAVFFNLDAEP